MLIKKTVFSILVLIISCFSIKAQDFEVPKKYKFKNETDYKAEESNIVKAVDWLLATPLHKEEKKRANVNAYLMKWLTGTPTFTLTVLPDAIPYMSDCPPCLMLYMGYWAKVSIETDNNNSSSEYSLAASKAVLSYYSEHIAQHGKIKSLEKLIKLEQSNKLEKWNNKIWKDQ